MSFVEYLGLYIDMVDTRASKRARESCQNAGDMLNTVNRTKICPPLEVIGGKVFISASPCPPPSLEYFKRTYSRRRSKSSIEQITEVRINFE